MQQIAMGLIAGLMGLVVLVIVAGWIVPLVLSIVGRRRHWASARGWRIAAVIWGAVAVLSVLGVGGMVLLVSRLTRDYEGHANNAKPFEATAYRGETATLRLAWTGEAECVIRDQADKTFRCVASNGQMTVPAGTLAIRECKAMATDAQGKPWTASVQLWNGTNMTLPAGATQDLELGPPFLVAVNFEWAPVSSKIRLEPAVADRSGNIYKIKCDQQSAVPAFQFTDAGGQTLWSGKFEFG